MAKASWTVLVLSLVSFGWPQQPTVEIRIKLINGINGKPMKMTDVGIENSAGYGELQARTNDRGIATLHILKDSSIITHNTKQYVACADEGGRMVRREFTVDEILSTGVIQKVSQPNLCHITSDIPTPGELVLFVRPWRLFEQTF